MDLRQLRYFVAVAAAGGFTRASAELGIAQPTLSLQIQRLEESLGVPLFERLGRGVRLTAAGELLLQHARELLRGVSEARQCLQALSRKVCGRLSVGAIPTVLPYWLADRLPQFRRRFPEVELRLVENLTDRLVQGLREGDLDVAVVGLPLRQPDVVCAEILREPLFAILPPEHPLARQAEVDPRQLRELPLLLLREGHCFRQKVIALCGRSGLMPAAVFESDQLESIRSLVAAGFGASLLPAMAASRTHGCAIVPLAGEPVRRIGYARMRRKYHSPAVAAFTDWLRSIARRHETGIRGARQGAKDEPTAARKSLRPHMPP